jgi:hypothetical protein
MFAEGLRMSIQVCGPGFFFWRGHGGEIKQFPSRC